MRNFRRKRALGVLIFIAVFAAAIAIVMLLWNALIPTIIGWTTISYWQAAGLMILCRLLLGGFGRFGKGHRPFDKADHLHWHKMGDKMKEMSKEERLEYIREHMRDARRFGRGCCDRKDLENTSFDEETPNEKE
ncbi:MAG: hypothetical protein E6767_17420 [Dysgonomonas sp.]|nr:hypothetical protein [Dysgonomonas sp.]